MKPVLIFVALFGIAVTSGCNEERPQASQQSPPSESNAPSPTLQEPVLVGSAEYTTIPFSPDEKAALGLVITDSVNGLSGAVVHGWVTLNSRAEPQSKNLQTSDIIVRLDEKPVKSASDVQAILETITPGSGVLAVVWRRGSYVSVGMRTGVARREDLEANNA